jgi:hypothetical protein
LNVAGQMLFHRNTLRSLGVFLFSHSSWLNFGFHSLVHFATVLQQDQTRHREKIRNIDLTESSDGLKSAEKLENPVVFSRRRPRRR